MLPCISIAASTFLTLKTVVWPTKPSSSFQLYHVVFISRWSLVICQGDRSGDVNSAAVMILTIYILGFLTHVGFYLKHQSSFSTFEIVVLTIKSQLKVHLPTFLHVMWFKASEKAMDLELDPKLGNDKYHVNVCHTLKLQQSKCFI